MSTKKPFIKREGKRIGTTVSDLLIRIVLIAYSVIVVYPVLWTIFSSFKTNQEFYKSAWALPQGIFFDNYRNAWETAKIGTYFLNSVIVVAITVVLTLILCATTAYVLARFKFWGNNFVQTLYMSGLYVPTILGIVPIFLLLVSLRMLDTWRGLIIIYTVFSLPFSVFVLISFFKTIPNELSDAARIDGCSEYGTFWRIMFPISKTGLITVSIFNYIWVWNDYLFGMTFITNDLKRTLPVGLVRLTETLQFKTEWGSLFAGLVIIMLPSIIIYALFQKQLTKGLTAGSIKG
ncbi:MAG: carbohydrate ABC transporter permease [Sphaerochaetaceae bacterium]|jgi:N-acetylglucosamine transport system permease protein|nr:carbohydrate ABC transporter permease [Sphaerochaetaceae bacterium]HHU89167.1 carbohydrate ABC transporter permease [Spirochaetales bacterium]